MPTQMTSLMSWSQLTDNRHAGELYELTGPRSLSFAEVAAEIAEATGRDIRYVPVSLEEHAADAAAANVAQTRRRGSGRGLQSC